MGTIAAELVEFVPVKDVGGPDYNEAIKLYYEMFPPEERKPLAHLESLLLRQVYRLFIARYDKQVVGFALIVMSHTPEFLFVDNIAISRQMQGCGLGSLFLEHLISLQSYTSLGVFLEIEWPSLAADEADRQVRNRRVGFYQRLGFVPLEGVDYQLPLKDEACLPLLLMFNPTDKINVLSADTLKAMILSVYDNIHYDVPERHKLLNTYAHTITDQVLA